MTSNNDINSGSLHKTINFIIRFSFCDFLNNQGLGKCYQPWDSSALLITLASTLIIPDITKTSSNNFLLFYWTASLIGVIIILSDS